MRVWLGIAFFGALAATISLRADEVSKIHPVDVAAAPAFDLLDCGGNRHTAAEWQGKRAVLLFFIAPECPVSNFYTAEYTRLSKSYADRGLVTYGVHCDDDLQPAEAAKHAEEYGLKFPILLDPKQKLTHAVGARITPEAVLLSPQGHLLYRGKIDDRFALNGKRRDVPTQHNLADAIDAVLAGHSPAEVETKCFGCPIPQSK